MKKSFKSISKAFIKKFLYHERLFNMPSDNHRLLLGLGIC